MEKSLMYVEDLRPGDQFWGDRPYAHIDRDGTPDDDDGGDFMVFEVLRWPTPSTNIGLFEGNAECVVVAVEYMDGAHGSRLYEPRTRMTIRRPGDGTLSVEE